MIDRLDYAIDLWKKGTRYKQLVFLTGQRPLDPSVDDVQTCYEELPEHKKDKIMQLPTNESEMAEFVYNIADMPQEMETMQISFVSIPMKPKQDGTFARPTTGDTVIGWINNNPKPGSCIAFSNQPYVAYQHAVLQTFLPSDFVLETVGCKANYEKLKASVLLDTVARVLYQENKRLNR